MEFLVPPQIETERLLLRQFEGPDWKELHHYYSDAEATAFTFRRALEEGDTWRTMCGMIGHWQVRGYGPYAVVEKSSKRVMGTVGFWYPNDWPEPEIKWGLARRYWGQGYASEAARIVHATGREHMPEVSLISLIHDANAASIGVALAIGARRERSTDYEGEPHGIYRHRTSD
jgi:RimJ/RimL family protein N-acetyltransferase